MKSTPHHIDRRAKSAFIFIFFTVLLDMIGIGLLIPVMPGVIRRFFQNESDVSLWFGWFTAIYALMQFIASPFLGALSDRYGRRPILLVSIAIAAVDYLFMAFAPTLTLLFAGRILSGLTGANHTVANAYIADISTDENRAKRFGFIGAAFGLGFILGPALGGLLAHFGPKAPFMVAAALNALNFCFGYFVLPESLSLNLRKKVSLRSLNPFSVFRILWDKNIRALLIIVFFVHLAGSTHPSIWALYTDFRFQWTASEIGLSLALLGALSALAQGGLTQLIIPKLGENKTVLYAAILNPVFYFMFGSATSTGFMIFTLIFSSIAWVEHPALQSLVTRSGRADQQGELQGTLVALSSLAAILNPLITTALFSKFSGSVPGAPYFFASAISAIALILIFGLLPRVKGLTAPHEKTRQLDL